MKDKGTVISTEDGFARVEVNCLSACDTCKARSLCIKNNQQTGLLSVRNTLHARPGDIVTIDVPDTTYSKTLIWLFGILLSGCLIGLALGYLASTGIPLDPSESSLIGLLLGVIMAGVWLHRRFRKSASANLYPIITDIESKGESHE
jgi:positive regulator of sigma E activity